MHEHEQSLFPGRDGWCYSPEGAAVHLEEKVAVIADLHLGYEWTRGGRGDQIPAHSLAETLARLDQLLARAKFDQLVVAGDVVESARPCARTSADLTQLRRVLADRGISLRLLPGNHDPRPRDSGAKTLEVAGWTIGHGHEPLAGPKTITGHDHPIFRANGISARCILVGPSAIILPAFTENAAGLNVASDPPPARWLRRELTCLVDAGASLLDFGPIDTLSERLRKSRVPG